MRIQNPFAAVNTTGVDSQILSVLASNEQYLTAPQIHLLLPEGGSVEGVRKALARLVSHGTVLERITGRTSAYSLNRQHILAEPILLIANAKRELIRRAQEHISTWDIPPLMVELFGSAARGDMSETSDIDLLVIMPQDADRDVSISQVDELATASQQWTGNDVRPLLYFEEEVQPASIFDSIQQEGVYISGDPSWLRRRLQKKSA